MRAALILLVALAAGPALACGPDTDCPVAGGTYRVHLPPGGAASGAILFAHGYKGSAAQTMGNASLVAMADDLGVALVALASAGDDWTLPDAPNAGRGPERDEAAYVRAVRDDVAARLGVKPDRTLLAGFSAGGMLVWNVACAAGDDFGSFAAFSGTFWRGPPEGCPTDAAIWHVHGTSDTVVPIGGRRIGPTRQGDVEEVLAMYRADKALAPAEPIPVADLDCVRWTGTAASLAYCLHPGGHHFRADWLRAIWGATFAEG